MTNTKLAAAEWHTLDADSVLQELQSSGSGLGSVDAAERLTLHGANRLPEKAERGVLVRFLLHFRNILIYVLLGAAVITFALGHLVDTFVILAVVLANAAIGFVQEGKAEKAMEAIRGMLAPRANVLRDGQRCSIAGETLVPGDIVLLEPGDKVPADLRLLQAPGLQIQEAVLTGESVPVDKHTRPVDGSAALGDRTCMAFSGTLVTTGQAKGVVVATGPKTEIGRISGMLADVEVLTTPLVRQMNVFAQWLTMLILLIAGVLLAYGYFVAHYEFDEMFMAVVGLSVAAIPEGLPAVLTITLAVGVQAMARRNAIVRRLPAIETLGSVSVICTDKTGTLTRNEMMVVSLVTGSHTFALEGTGYEPSGAIKLEDAVVDVHEHEVLDEFGRAAILCNDASLRDHEGVWTTEGDPMEGALLALAAKLGLNAKSELATWVRTDVIPFDARHRFMATLNHDHQGHAFVAVKGAPETLLSMCSGQRVDPADTESLSKARAEALDVAHWHEQTERIAIQGQRVLALAFEPTEENTIGRLRL